VWIDCQDWGKNTNQRNCTLGGYKKSHKHKTPIKLELSWKSTVTKKGQPCTQGEAEQTNSHSHMAALSVILGPHQKCWMPVHVSHFTLTWACGHRVSNVPFYWFLLEGVLERAYAKSSLLCLCIPTFINITLAWSKKAFPLPCWSLCQQHPAQPCVTHLPSAVTSVHRAVLSQGIVLVV
jgi:hypothetical protein